MKKLPIGIQTLSTIIEEGYAYVDKTKIALDLIDRGRYYFLSRPRRFGKSLFLNTLQEIFEGNETLFKGLYIDKKWNFNKINPVIHISFGAGGTRSVKDLHRKMHRILEYSEEKLGIQIKGDLLPSEKLSKLIRSAHKKTRQKVVILIDEYDKPILDLSLIHI